MDNKGNFCFFCRWGDFAKLNTDAWLEEMIRNSSLVHDSEPSDAQCRAWLSSRRVLIKALKALPRAYSDCYLLFEYVLPKYKPGTKRYEREKGIRPDVLVVGSRFVTVLEFKGRKTDDDGSVFEGYISQARKYVTRLNKYHAASADMFVSALLVLTLEKDLLDDRDDIVIASADRLADALLLLDGADAAGIEFRDFDAWLRSDIRAPEK